MDALFNSLLGNVDWYEIWLATLDTLLMLGGSLLFTILLGLPLGEPWGSNLPERPIEVLLEVREDQPDVVSLLV